MASREMILRVADLYHLDPKKYWVPTALTDFTDTEVAAIMARYRPETIWDLYDALTMQTNDPNVHAHLLGFASAEDRKAAIDAFEKMKQLVIEDREASK